MAVANTLAYYDAATITALKSFIVQATVQGHHMTLQFVNLRKSKLWLKMSHFA
jgi:hypothetical protein